MTKPLLRICSHRAACIATPIAVVALLSLGFAADYNYTAAPDTLAGSDGVLAIL